MSITFNDLFAMLAAAKNQAEYDRLIDRYIFGVNQQHRNTKNNRIDNVLTANQMQQKNRKEFPTNPDFL